jgi:aminoglycoside phosphotransferase (APT) family kinase protein
MLLEHVPGEDFYGAGLDERLRIGGLAHQIQLTSVDAVEELVASGVPDRRGAAQAEWIRQRLSGWTEGHPAEALLADLDARLDELDACGLPWTLVHGDAHPGNVRGDSERTVFLDWGDAFVGNPVFDLRGMTGGQPVDAALAYTRAWVSWWRTSVPGSDPARAAQLAGPLASLRLAAVYADFLANIEPAQHVFHAEDVRLNLDAAVESAVR